MIHATAIIDPSAHIDETAEIGPSVVIGPKTVIHAHVQVYPHAIIEHAEIGEGCIIFPGASVGLAPQDLKYNNEETRLIIGAHTTIREYATLHRGTGAGGVTRIGSNCLYMAYSHVAHDCVIGNEVIVANSTAIAGHVEIEDGAFLGGLVGIHQFVRIGKYAMIGAGSMVPLDVPPFTLGAGDRMKLVGLNVLGLKRRRFSLDAIKKLKHAYQQLFLSHSKIEDALRHLEAGEMSDEVKHLVHFIRRSKRGICTARSRSKIEEGLDI